VLAIVAFAEAWRDDGERPGSRIRWIPTLALGLVLGCALATKLTGWFLPLPFLAWAALRRDRRAWKVLLIALPLAVLVLYALNPSWWAEPITGVFRFLRSNLTRGQTQPIPVQFLGTIYQTPNQSLPWYNTLVWTAFVTPVGFLLLAATGIVGAVIRRRNEPLGLLIAGHWLLLMALRAMPHVPGHDGVRLFLPAFGVLSLLVGLGARQWCDWIGPWARGLVAAATLEGAISVALMMPVPLSYFSPMVGGLPGAVRLGMEPTYYWDGLTDEARAWLRANTPEGRTVRFATFPTSWFYLRGIGELPPVYHWRFDPRPPAWYVLQNRPGAWPPLDRLLFREERPAFSIEKHGVPLVLIYPFDRVEQRALSGPR